MDSRPGGVTNLSATPQKILSYKNAKGREKGEDIISYGISRIDTDKEMPIFIRENPCESVAKKTLRLKPSIKVTTLVFEFGTCLIPASSD